MPTTGAAPSPLLVTGARVCAGDGVWSPGWLLAAGGRIEALGPGTTPAGLAGRPGLVAVDGTGGVLLPGFIDVHVHGGDGAEAMDADADGLRRLARFHAAHGVTAVVPTTWAAP